MKHTNTAAHQPTHEEIALHAFLIWEQEGRQSGYEQTYWLQAEAQLHLTRKQQAELAATKSARPWPPAPAAAPKLATARAAKPAAPKPAKPAPVFRDIAMKPAARTKPVRKAMARA